MMARRFASESGHVRQAHSKAYGREAQATRRRKAPARARAGPQGRLVDYPGLIPGTPGIRIIRFF